MAQDIVLPPPALTGPLSVEEAIYKRHSVRSFTNQPLSIPQISQLLWAAQGITHTGNRRAAPSAGASYPLELYLVVGEAIGLRPGIYSYTVEKHALKQCSETDQREALCKAAHSQSCVIEAPVCMVISGIYDRVAKKFGNSAKEYTWAEAGCAAENVAFQALSLELGTVYITTFDPKAVHNAMGLTSQEHPIAIVPVGFPAS